MQIGPNKIKMWSKGPEGIGLGRDKDIKMCANHFGVWPKKHC